MSVSYKKKGSQYQCAPGTYRDNKGNIQLIPNPLPSDWICLPGIYVGPRLLPEGQYKNAEGCFAPIPKVLPEGWICIPGLYVGPDRRKEPTPMISRFLFWGKREKNLSTDLQTLEGYTDIIHAHAWLFFWSILTLSTVDAAFSIYFIVYGNFQEANPVLRPFIESHPVAFLVVKYALTLAGLLFLITHQHFRIFKAAMVSALTLYGSLCAYHFYLLFLNR